MRQYVRAWINEWDLLRLDPAYHPSTEALDIVTDYHQPDEPDVHDGTDGPRLPRRSSAGGHVAAVAPIV